MAIYDVFTYNDELEMLLVRLVEHGPFVDTFVLIQGDKTFTGKAKPFYFPVKDDRLKPFLHKILVINIPLSESPASPWDNELKQRNASFSSFPINPADIIYLSDVDEIISRNAWPQLLERMESESVLSVWLEMFNFYINLRLNESLWIQPKLLRGDTILKTVKTANDFRVDYALPHTEHWCGWHFSYIMPPDKIAEKIKSFSHHEFNRPLFTDTARIKDQLRKRRDLLKRDLEFEPVEVTNQWPVQMVENPYWKQFICSTDPIRSNMSDLLSDYLFWTAEHTRTIKNKLKIGIKQILLRLGLIS